MNLIDFFSQIFSPRLNGMNASENWAGGFILDTNDIPVVIDMSPSRTLSLLIAGACCFGLIVVFVNGLQSKQGAYEAWFFILLVGSLGVAMALRSFHKATVDFRNDGAHVTLQTLFGKRKWSVFYGQYRGVGHYTKTVRSKNSHKTYRIVELVHTDQTKNIPLRVDGGGSDLPAHVEAYAEFFGVPVLSRIA